MHMDRRLWKIEVTGRLKRGQKIILAVHQKGYDAGDAWLNFAEHFSGAWWERISVTEVKKDERPEQ